MSDRFDQYYILQNQAKKMEQAGNHSKAIELFGQIVAEFQPYDDYAYDRLSVLLEKSFRFSEAAEVCAIAIEKITSGTIKGDANRFKERQHRLQEKLKSGGQESVGPKEKEAFLLRLPLLHHLSGKRVLLPVVLYGIALAVSVPNHWLRFSLLAVFYGFLDYLIDALIKLSKNKRAGLTLLVSFLFLGATAFVSLQLPEVKAIIQLQEDPKVAESEVLEKPGSDAVIEVPDEAIVDQALLDKAKRTIELEAAYVSCLLTVSENIISAQFIVKASTSEDEVQRIMQKLAKNISALAAAKGTSAPMGDDYGSLYSTYTFRFETLDSFGEPLSTGKLFKNKWSLN